MTGMVRAAMTTTGDRPQMLFRAIQTFLQRFPEYPLTISTQAAPGAVMDALRGLEAGHEGRVSIVAGEHRTGPHNARVAALRTDTSVRAWVSIDDDMEFLPETNYAPCLDRAEQPGVGLVSTMWTRNHGSVRALSAKMQDRFVPSPHVITGGGLIVSKRALALILSLPEARYVCDNTAWSLRVYTAGYMNEEYRGSLAIHKPMAPGGRVDFLRSAACDDVDPSLVRRKQRPGEPMTEWPQNNVAMPTSASYTAEAHEAHALNRKRVML